MRRDASGRSAALTRRNSADIIGVVVSEMAIDTKIAIASVIANSRKSRPTIPLISRIGRNAATSDSVIVTIVNPTSPAPRNAASVRDIPLSR